MPSCGTLQDVKNQKMRYCYFIITLPPLGKTTGYPELKKRGQQGPLFFMIFRDYS